MIKKRFTMGVVAIAAIIGLAAGPTGGAAAATANKSVLRNFSIPRPSVVVVQLGLHWTGNGIMRVGFRDVGVPGDSFRATYVDATTSITGVCAASSKRVFVQSLAVHIPSSRNFRIRIRWCRGPGIFPAGGQMLILP